MEAFQVSHVPKLASLQREATFPASHVLKLSNLQREAFPVHRSIRISYPRQRQRIVCEAESVESGVDGPLNQRTVSPSLLAAEKAEAKAVLNLFLKKQGFSHTLAAKTINLSDFFIEHLVSELHSAHKTRYLVGRELSTLEIRETLLPYLESLLEEHGDTLIDVVENFPSLSGEERPVAATPSISSPNHKKVKAVARVSEDSNGQVPARLLYLLDLGMDIERIRLITRRFPAFAYYSLEGKIKPLVEFLLDLGVDRDDIPTIIYKRPQLCGISLSEKLIPMMTYLENLGVDKKQWAKVIQRSPTLLTNSRHKVQANIDFLYELGLKAETVGKVITRCPHILSYSVEDKLRPTAEYFRSMGVDAGVLIYQAPYAYGLSIEGHLKPSTEFFLDKGYCLEDVRTMASKYGVLYTFSLARNIIPKWEFFLTLGYPKSELVKFPQYFGYSFERRIKPRFEQVKRSGVKLMLAHVLSRSETEFEKLLNRKMKKKLDDENASSS